jgi:hypothetical protein
MSEYAYIPDQNKKFVQLQYSIASPDTWGFTRAGEQYAGMEEGHFNEAQILEITSLGGECFHNADEFLEWLHS